MFSNFSLVCAWVLIFSGLCLEVWLFVVSRFPSPSSLSNRFWVGIWSLWNFSFCLADSACFCFFLLFVDVYKIAVTFDLCEISIFWRCGFYLSGRFCIVSFIYILLKIVLLDLFCSSVCKISFEYMCFR